MMDSRPTLIGILGKPLAGKDTVANAIATFFPDTALISMGEVLREVRATGPSHRFWDKLSASSQVAAEGGMAAEEPVMECLTELISEQIADGKRRIIWIAGPRTMQELAMLDTWARQNDIREQFLHVDVPDDVVYERLTIRDDGREDDRVPDVRMRVFNEVTRPVIEALRDQGRLMEMSGLGGVEIVGRRAVERIYMMNMDPEVRLPKMARR